MQVPVRRGRAALCCPLPRERREMVGEVGAVGVISVKCPKCHEFMEIDTATGAVLRHHEEVKSRPGADFLGTRLRELEQEKARREAVVEHGREREKNRQGEFEKLFRKVKEEHSSGSR
jgi:phage FluMu protein Com